MRHLPLLLLLGCPVATDTGTSTDTDLDTSGGDTGADTGDSGSLNGAPGAPTVSITPATPGDDTTLRASMDVGAVDPDGDALTYRYEWLQNGTVVAGETNDFVVSEATTLGDVWTLNVYASDGELEGPAGTASATIADLPPVAPTIHLDPVAPVSGDGLTLVFDTPANDPNGDTLDQTIVWSENGTHNSSWDGRTTIDGVYVDGGDTFQVVVTVTDNDSEPISVEASVTVPNSAPEITAVEISPTTPKDNNDLTCKVTAKDPDGGKVTKTYLWYRDGVAATEVGDTDTVTADFTTVGEQWECEATVSDGTTSTTAMSAAVEIAAPSGFRVTSRVDMTVTTDSAGAHAGTGTAEWVLFSNTGSVSNQCDIYWSLVATEDKTVCRGCDYSFDADYTYDAAASTTVTGCADMSKDSTGSAAYDSRMGRFVAELDDPGYSGYYSTVVGLSMDVTGSGGYSWGYYGYYVGEYYSVVQGLDAAGNLTISAYHTNYRYY